MGKRRFIFAKHLWLHRTALLFSVGDNGMKIRWLAWYYQEPDKWVGYPRRLPSTSCSAFEASERGRLFGQVVTHGLLFFFRSE